jgi:tetratricopeptide (TPR) repeat protein
LPSPNEDPAPASRCVTDRSVARTLRGDLDAVVGKALRHDPARRYETMQAFAGDLENHLAGRPVQARPDGALYIAGRFARRHWIGLSAVTAVCVAIVAGGATAIVQARHAEREAERARAATEFVAELFRLNAAGPTGSDTAAAPTEFIDRGASLIEARFAGQPEMQAELLGAVGQAYGDMGANALAADYANRRIQLLQQLPDTRKQLVESLLLASNSYVQDEDDEAAEAAARRAIEASGTAVGLRLESLAALARAQFDSGSIAPARQTVELAQSLIRATSGVEESVAAAHVLCVQAMLLTLGDNLDESRPQFASAVSAALRAEGPGSRTAEDVLYTRAIALLRLGLFEEAHLNFDQAMSVLHQRSNSVARVREAVRSAHFWTVANEKIHLPFQESLAKVRASHDTLQALGNTIPPVVRAKVDFELGVMFMDWTDVRQAVAWLDPSTTVLQRSKLSMRSRMSILGVQAYMDRLLGRDAEGLALQWELLRLTKQLHGTESLSTALGYGWLANELAWQTQFDRAEQVLNDAPRVGEASQGSQAALKIARVRIEIALARGDIQRAKELLPSMDVGHSVEDMRVVALRSRVLCQAGDPVRGLTMMRDAIRRNLAIGANTYDPDIAVVRSHAGLCALVAGQRPLAAECAREARRAFDEQPLVGPRYRARLVMLERALHMTSGNTPLPKASTPKVAPDETC